MSEASDSERRRDELFDELLADVNKLVLETSATTDDTVVVVSLPTPVVKKVPPPLPAKDPSLHGSATTTISSTSSSSSTTPVSPRRVEPTSSTVTGSTGAPSMYKVHLFDAQQQYTTIKCAQADATVSDLLALALKKRSLLQQSSAVVGEGGKECCLTRFGTFEILDPSTRLADLWLQHGSDLQFALDDVASVIAKFAASAGVVASESPVASSPKKTPPASAPLPAPLQSSSSSSLGGTFGTINFRNYFSVGSGSSAADYSTPEYATGTKAFNLLADDTTLMQGWLRKKRKGSKAPWRRRWIIMGTATLHFYRAPEAACADVKARSLRFAQVKRGVVDSLSVVGAAAAAAAASGDDMAHLQFEVMFGSSGEDSGAVFIFEAASDAEHELWTSELAKRCEALMLEAIDATPKSSSAERLAAHVAEPGNARCADCGAAPVEWASAKRGVTLCTSCSGVHRALGVHLSTVRSLSLDTWPAPLLADFLAFGGNRVVNQLLESALPAELAATRDASTGDVVGRDACDAYSRETFARAKYGTFSFVADEKSAEWIAMTARVKDASV